MPLRTPHRFSKKVAVNPETGCHEWTGAKVRGGYGHFRDGEKMVPAHRYQWELIHGEVPDDLKVCHSCANPVCVNPAHLYLDTHRSNMAKMSKSGRIAKGRTHGAAKLNEGLVLKIIELYATNRYSKRQLGRMFGVTGETIAKVVTRKRWRHVTE